MFPSKPLYRDKCPCKLSPIHQKRIYCNKKCYKKKKKRLKLHSLCRKRNIMASMVTHLVSTVKKLNGMILTTRFCKLVIESVTVWTAWEFKLHMPRRGVFKLSFELAYRPIHDHVIKNSHVQFAKNIYPINKHKLPCQKSESSQNAFKIMTSWRNSSTENINSTAHCLDWSLMFEVYTMTPTSSLQSRKQFIREKTKLAGRRWRSLLGNKAIIE